MDGCAIDRPAPGDIVKLRNGANEAWDIPADMVLIRGNVVCNESGLTGEPMPVNKKALPKAEATHDLEVQTNALMSHRNRRSSRMESVLRESFALDSLVNETEKTIR